MGESIILHLEIPPYQSVVVVFDELEDIVVKPHMQYDEGILLKEGWTMSLAKSIEYPKFYDEQEISCFENVALKYPKFSGFIHYENEVEVTTFETASLFIEE